MKLSANFSLDELIKSQVAERKGINNNPSPTQIDNLKLLCEKVLQPVRDNFGVVNVSSGFRSAELCIAIGSSVNSQHADGQACDFEIFGKDNEEVADWVYRNTPIDEPNSGWIHASYNPNEQRKQYLIAYREDGKVKYKPKML